jgi:hypothetical protein
LSEVLSTGKDKYFGALDRFGDIDVLAWKGDRVLVIECKHLQFHKNLGEIAEQLSDYQGKTKRNGKPDDLLKHLNRMEVLRARRALLRKKLKIMGRMRIEGWIVFKHSVPMLYAWNRLRNKSLNMTTYDELEQIL